MIVFLIISLIVNVLLGYAAFNASNKITSLEEAVNYFYSRLEITLQLMRTIDEKQMFEKDDEVGEVFTQLTDIVNDLRPVLYGSIIDGETSKESVG
jgi:ABC-type uncharacterized transport system permease subunit